MLAIFISALLVRLLSLWSLRESDVCRILIGDALHFDEAAWKIATGQMQSEVLKITLSPVYLAFLSSIYGVFQHSLLAPRVFQMVLGSASCVLLGVIGRRIWNEKAGFLAGLIGAFYGIFIFYDGQLLKPSLTQFLLLLAVYLLVLAVKTPSLFVWIAAGAIFSTASLLKNQLLVTAPFIAVWIWLTFNHGSRPRTLLYILVSGLSFGMSWFLWKGWESGAVPHREAAGVETGIHFYIGNNPAANGTYVRVLGIRNEPIGHSVDAKRIVEREKKRPVTPAEVNAYWLEKGVEYIAAHPLEWVLLEAKKLFLLFNAYEIPNDENYDYARGKSRLLSLPLFSFGLIAPLGFLGLFVKGKEEDQAGRRLLTLILISYSLALLLTLITGAYRLPIQPILILFASHTLLWMRDQAVSKAFRKMALAASALVFFLFLTNLETYLPREKYNEAFERRLERAKRESVNYPLI